MTQALADVAILEKLDFAIPCATLPEWHKTFGSGPADWILDQRCPGCGFQKEYPVCSGCRAAMESYSDQIACSICQHKGYAVDWFHSFRPIR